MRTRGVLEGDDVRKLIIDGFGSTDDERRARLLGIGLFLPSRKSDGNCDGGHCYYGNRDNNSGIPLSSPPDGYWLLGIGSGADYDLAMFNGSFVVEGHDNDSKALV